MKVPQINGQLLLEVCVGSVEDAIAAEQAGADRLELCSAVELGGLTPSVGLLEQTLAEVKLPVMAMIRPRPGGFFYSLPEFRTMMLDAERLLDVGAQGIVFGPLDQARRVHSSQVQELVGLAGERETVFHKAFDFVSCQREALDKLIELNVRRVLTGGGHSAAIDGVEQLEALVNQSGGSIEILPGGGITAENVAELISVSGCRQIHVGAAGSRFDESISHADAVALCDMNRLAAGELRVVDRENVIAIRRQASSA